MRVETLNISTRGVISNMSLSDKLNFINTPIAPAGSMVTVTDVTEQIEAAVVGLLHTIQELQNALSIVLSEDPSELNNRPSVPTPFASCNLAARLLAIRVDVDTAMVQLDNTRAKLGLGPSIDVLVGSNRK